MTIQEIVVGILLAGLVITIGTLIDVLFIAPQRHGEISKKIVGEMLKDFESKIPDEKFMYTKKICPRCDYDLTKDRQEFT